MKKLRGNAIVEATLICDFMTVLVLVGFVLICTEVAKSIETNKYMVNVGLCLTESTNGKIEFCNLEDTYTAEIYRYASYGITCQVFDYSSSFPKLVNKEYSDDISSINMVLINPFQRRANRFTYKRWFQCEDSELDEIDREFGLYIY